MWQSSGADMFEEKHAMHTESSAKCGQKRTGKKGGRNKNTNMTNVRQCKEH